MDHLSMGCGFGMVPKQQQKMEQRMELKQIQLPRLDVPAFETTKAERTRLTGRDHWYRLEMEQAKAGKDQVRYAILGVVQELDRLLGFGSSFFFDPAAYEQYSRGKSSTVHLNSASHAPPFPEAKEYAERIYRLCEAEDAEHPMNRTLRQEFLQHVREQVAAHANLEPHQVVLCRNTTEAARIAALVSDVLTTRDLQNKILFTDGVHISVLMHLLLDDDPGNVDRKDRFSSWPTYYARRGQHYDPLKTKLGKGEFGMFSVKGKSLEEMKKELDGMLECWWEARNIGMIVLPHVLRETGEILPIKELCDHIRKRFAHHCTYYRDIRQPFILIDGAQAEGTVPGCRLRFKERKEDTDGLDCDAYISSPHKTLHSDVLGILYLRDFKAPDSARWTPENPVVPMRSELRMSLAHIKHLRDIGRIPSGQAVILDGMFDPSLGIRPNVRDHLDCADAAGYLAAQRVIAGRTGAEGEEYTCKHRARLKELFRHELREQARQQGVKIVLPRSHFEESPFIQSIELPGTDGRQVVESIASDTFLSWIGEEARIRASFGLTNTEADIRAAARRIVEASRRMHGAA